MVLKVYLKFLLIVLFYAIKFFYKVILADELFAKALPSLETCVLVNNNLWEKLFLSTEPPITFDEIFKATSVPFFIPDSRIRQLYV